MSLRGTGAGEDQLWPQVLPGGPLARWHKPQFGSVAGIGSNQKGFRADRDAPAETCKKDPDGIFFGLAAAIETRI